MFHRFLASCIIHLLLLHFLSFILIFVASFPWPSSYPPNSPNLVIFHRLQLLLVLFPSPLIQYLVLHILSSLRSFLPSLVPSFLPSIVSSFFPPSPTSNSAQAILACLIGQQNPSAWLSVSLSLYRLLHGCAVVSLHPRTWPSTQVNDRFLCRRLQRHLPQASSSSSSQTPSALWLRVRYPQSPRQLTIIIGITSSSTSFSSQSALNDISARCC